MSEHLWIESRIEESDVELEVKGLLPEWLKGHLLRNGPVLYSIGGKRVGHWFDGLGMLHAFSFSGGRVRYSNKFMRSEAYEKVFKERSFRYVGFACDPCHVIFKRLFTAFFGGSNFPIHNANVNVAKIAERFVGLTETPLPVEFDLQTLETVGVLDYEDKLPKANSFESAHPHIDPETGDIISYLVKFGMKSSYQIYRMGRKSLTRKVFAELAVSEPSYMHSFSLTPNYVIFAQYPLVVNPLDLLIKGKPFITNYRWEPQKGTQFLIVDRHSGLAVRRYQAESFFSFHHVNAYEQGDDIILDLVAYPDATIVDTVGSYGEPLARLKVNNALAQTKLTRFCFMLKTDQFSQSVVLEAPLEFPRINLNYDGKPYRFLYAADIREPQETEEGRQLLKIEVAEKKNLSWFEAGCCPGEPVFVARPGGVKEDDGVVLAIVYDQKKNSSFLLVLDAGSFKEVARAEVKHKIPLGLHGQYYSL